MTILSKIQIQIVRDGSFYFYNRTEDGRIAVIGQRITADRAKDIYQANETAIASGAVTFEPGAYSWSWTSKPTEGA